MYPGQALRARNRAGALLGAVGLVLVGCLLIAALGLFLTGGWRQPVLRVRGTAAVGPSVPAVSPTADPALQAAQAIVAPAGQPARLLVPSIKVDAPVEPVGLDAQGRMGTPAQASDVAWFSPGVTPGDVGDAVVAGHLDWTSGPAVFWLLGKVRRGDEITVVRANGSRATFVTDATSMVPYDSDTRALFTRDGPPSLTLITCAGTWDRQRGTYLQRLVVHASLAPTVSTTRSGDEGG
jgi:LPXTG-site transpeptidase (sortase) family protein